MSAERGVGLILGASSGVGSALAQALAGRQSIVAVARRLPQLEGVLARSCDIGDYTAVEALFRSLADQPLDFVVNCVGVGFYAPLDGNYSAYWETILRTNLLGLANVLSNLLRFPAPCGHFVQVGSMAAHRPSPTPGNAMYGASKAAALPLLDHFRAYVRERGLGLRVSLLSPGYIRGTDFGNNFFRSCPEAAFDLYRDVPSLTPESVVRVLIDILYSDPGLEMRDILLCPTPTSATV